MDILSILNFNHKIWPYAAMAFLRVLSLIYFLPIFGDQNVLSKLKISLSLIIFFFIFPLLSNSIVQSHSFEQWNFISIVLASIREVFFGFATGFCAKLVIFSAVIASQIIGINMGFQVASIFSPGMNEQESAFTVFHNLVVIMLILSLNIHYFFIESIFNSFIYIPIGTIPDANSILKICISFITETFILGLKLAAPLMAVQLIINIALGLLNRALPALNVFVINFPLGFLISVLILLLSSATFINVISSYGMEKEVAWYQTLQRAFHYGR